MTRKNLRESFSVKLARFLQKLPLKVFRFLEWPWVANCEPSNAKIFVLLALPRSGSTLTYQTLIHRYNFQYLSNLGNLLYQLPLISGLVSRVKCKGHYSNFRSQRGFIPGLCGPSEGLMFWHYWAGIGLKEQEIEALGMRQKSRILFLAKVYAKLTNNKAPLVTGYLGHSLGLERIKEAFPNAVPIRLVRNPIDNALSILNCMGSDTNWFSVIPLECTAYDTCNKLERVAAQVYWLNRKLDISLDDSAVVVHYEALCESPNEALELVKLECKKLGWDIGNGHLLPATFNLKSTNVEQSEVIKTLHSLLCKLEEKHGRLKHNSVLNNE
ncbi:sulfotransferase [Idiomarina sp. HB]|uniref:sulfotransferase n=1 Tax=Idiomarina sp. HB TaxID=3110479 RepID=UPI003A80727B